MKNITKEELNVILENHKHWINRDIEGWSRMRADLKDTCLVGVNLTAYDLRGVDFRDADLERADLSFAYLGYAILNCANLKSAYLKRSVLLRADLIGADLEYADLNGACLTGANLRNADLKDANLEEADLTDTYLVDAKNVPYIPMTCPDTGAFVGWKVCKDDAVSGIDVHKAKNVMVKLLIPEDAKRSSATGRKCRCDKAIVLDIEGADIAYSIFYNKFTYRKGETVTVDNFDSDRFVECGNGIHFFINKEEAIEYGKRFQKKT